MLHTEARLKCHISMEVEAENKIMPFSAFWLRSSVVSVLMGFISNTWPIRPHDFNLISFMEAASA